MKHYLIKDQSIDLISLNILGDTKYMDASETPGFYMLKKVKVFL
jgi:hypothetical protein